MRSGTGSPAGLCRGAPPSAGYIDIAGPQAAFGGDLHRLAPEDHRAEVGVLEVAQRLHEERVGLSTPSAPAIDHDVGRAGERALLGAGLRSQDRGRRRATSGHCPGGRR